MLDWAHKNGVYVLLMGDLLESGMRDSVGDSVYRQKLDPQEQMEEVIELLEPLADEGLILGLHMGNHEFRITKSTGIDVCKLMARILKVPYLGYSCWSILSVNRTRYTLYSTHGTGGSRFKHTKLKKAMDVAAHIDSDILAYGHLHSLAAESTIKQVFDRRKNKVTHKKQYVVLTGSYLRYDNSYAQMMDYPITRIGSPKAKLMSGEKDIHFSF